MVSGHIVGDATRSVLVCLLIIFCVFFFFHRPLEVYTHDGKAVNVTMEPGTSSEFECHYGVK